VPTTLGAVGAALVIALIVDILKPRR
jgi:hypothetical protein